MPIIIIIIITSSDDIQPSTLISDQSPSGLLLNINVTGISFSPNTLYMAIQVQKQSYYNYNIQPCTNNLWIAAAWSAFSYHSKACPNLGPDILTT